jgi:DNA-binding SARP family transcriptional activator
MVCAKSCAMREASFVLLGAPYVEHLGIRLDFLPERRYALLAHLAARGTWVSRDALAFMFWPDQTNAGARRNLRWVLHSAREIPGFDAVEAERDRIRLIVATDVRRFDVAVREQRWADAVGAYGGPLCAGFDAEHTDPFAQWLRIERARFAELFHRAAMTLIETVPPLEAVALARRLVESDPGDEEALCAGLRALRDLGEIREAKRLYHEFSVRLMDELGLEPGAATRSLAQELEAPLAAPVPPRRSNRALSDGAANWLKSRRCSRTSAVCLR